MMVERRWQGVNSAKYLDFLTGLNKAYLASFASDNSIVDAGGFVATNLTWDNFYLCCKEKKEENN